MAILSLLRDTNQSDGTEYLCFGNPGSTLSTLSVIVNDSASSIHL